MFSESSFQSVSASTSKFTEIYPSIIRYFFFTFLLVRFTDLDVECNHLVVTGTEFAPNFYVTDKAFLCRENNI